VQRLAEPLIKNEYGQYLLRLIEEPESELVREDLD
jgi:hypothetical protein